jgi:hypothetical protein
LAEVEALSSASRRELNLQFQRIAHMQADLDLVLRSARSTPPAHRHEQNETGDPKKHASRDALDADLPSLPRRRRS